MSDSDNSVEERLTMLNERGVEEKHLNDVQLLTLHSLLIEIAVRLRVSPEQFERHYDIRYRHYYDELMQDVRKHLPELADRIDQRHPNSPSISEEFPPMFPDL